MNWHYVYFSRTPIITGLDFLTSDVAVSDHASEQISLLYFSIHTSDRTVHFTAKWNKMYTFTLSPLTGMIRWYIHRQTLSIEMLIMFSHQ